MVEQRSEPHKPPPEPSLHPIEERDSSANTSAATSPEGTPVGTSNDDNQTSSNPREQTPEQRYGQQISEHQRSQQPVPRSGHSSTPRQEQLPTPLSARAAFSRHPTESGSAYYGPQTPHESPRWNRTMSQQTASRWPSHSLAGPNMMDAPQQGVYVDPNYRQLNPRYGRNNEEPVWGLAKPLPRVVRPGMRRGEEKQQKAYGAEPPGETQPAPEVGATPGMSTSQSGTAESRPQQQPQGPPTYSSAAQQGVATEHAVYAPQQDGTLRPMETEASDMPSQKPGAEQVEMEQPPQEEFLNLWVKIRHYMKEPFAEFLAVSLPCMSVSLKLHYTNIPVLDSSRRPHRSLRYTCNRNRRNTSRVSIITELVLGARFHDRYLPSRWHFRCSPQPRHLDCTLDLPWLSRSTLLLLRDSASPWSNCGSWSDLLYLQRCYPALRAPSICRSFRAGFLHRATRSCEFCDCIFHRVYCRCDLVMRDFCHG